MNNKIITLLTLVAVLGFVLYGAAYWGQRHAHRPQTMVDAIYLDLLRKQSECVGNRDWTCVVKMNKAVADQAAARRRAISGHGLVVSSVVPKVDEFLALHETLSPAKFVMANKNQEEARPSQNGKQSRPPNYTIRPTPYYVNGKLRGFRVYPGTDRDAFNSLGFRAGDLIVEIDGQPVDDPAFAIEQFRKLFGGQPVQVRIERDGQSKVIEIQANLFNTE